MTICYCLPGISGSTLSYDQAGANTLWVNYTQLLLGQVGGMRLAPDGVSPGPPDGVQLYAQAPLPDYYQVPYGTLAEQLAPHGYTTPMWGYDWRLRCRSSGARLAAQIRAEVSAADPCAIVGHSFGGLVARSAYANLVATGESNLVRRIVSLGSPHYGSYGTPDTWSGGADLITQLAWITSAAYAIQRGVTPLPFTRAWTSAELIRLTATWPSLYEVLPNLGGPDAIADPSRNLLYDAGNWPSGLGISQAYLDYVRDDFGPFLLGAAANPPPWVMTTVAGTGLQTFASLQAPAVLGQESAMAQIGEGDGTVTVTSANLTNSAQWTLTGAHNDLPRLLALPGVLAGMVLQERVSPDPPPPPAAAPGSNAPLVSGPPIAVPLFPGRTCVGTCGLVGC